MPKPELGRAHRLARRWATLSVRGRGLLVAGVIAVLVLGIVLIRLLDPDSAVSTTASPSSSSSAVSSSSDSPGPGLAGSASEGVDSASPESGDATNQAGNAAATQSRDGTGAQTTGGSVGGDSASVTVHVVGAVGTPGLYTLNGAARVDAAISSAGGATPNADISQINLARRLVDGEQIRVPAQGEIATPIAGEGAGGTAGGGGSASGQGPISLSRATAEQLDALPRIGPALAARIVEWRESNGPFRSVEDLTRVSGIGPKMIASLRGKVTP
ncbi:ComEA family DNA-binding protein [Mycetocola sp. JXN-3]|uniref:ComEA family DNA-binding protein n=1 Tax=Mycetocola sp. JXN-3 TaxID=2116510 RepID=UPI00165CFB3A|nr:ComEA family DNA-binding protein [Mycetocola sp. JXN-3]